MDKGIFYLLCSAITIASVAVVGVLTVGQVSKQCSSKTVVYREKMVYVTPAVSPTVVPLKHAATSSAVVK